MQRTRDVTRARHTNDLGTIHDIMEMSPSSKADVVYFPILSEFILKRGRVRLKRKTEDKDILRSRGGPPPLGTEQTTLSIVIDDSLITVVANGSF